MRLLRFSGLFVLVFALCCQMAFAGTTGKISGVILDKEDKTPIPGASVHIDGTTIGAKVNPIDGTYVIQNVPPGTYTLIAQCLGYHDITVKDLLVHADLTTEQDFEMVSKVIEMDSIIVVAQEPEINKFETSSVTRISTKEIESLPVTNVQGIIKTQTGFVSQGGALHVRGSRAGELAFVDDGVMIRDQLGGYGSVNTNGNDATPISRISMNMAASDIEDISIMKGNYSAEYGDMTGGLITTHRKEGSNKITKFNLEFTTDDFGFASLNKYSFNQDIVNATLSGPVPVVSDKLFPALGLKWPGEKMAYFASLYVDKSDSYVDYNDFPSPKSKIDYGYDRFLGMNIPNRRINKYAGTGKLTWKMDANSRYKWDFRYTKEWDKANDFQYQYLYTPETARYLKSSKEIMSAKLTFNPPFLKDTFGEFMVSEVTQTYERRPGNLDPSNFYVPLEGFESYTDSNHNGKWDAAEYFEDLNHDGVWGEPYTDSNFNGRWDEGEPFSDINNNGRWDPEPFQDTNGNGTWDPAENVLNDCYYVDVNGNGIYDDGDSVYVDQDGNGNGRYDPQLSDLYNTDVAEAYADGDSSLGEPFDDVNGNGTYDEGVDGWSPAFDYDHNGHYTSPEDDWSDGIPYIDRNNNGRYDAPNLHYDYGEQFDDANGNGRWDSADLFLDSGYDQYAQYHYDYSRYRTIKLDITSQLSRYHDVKAGFEFKFHKIIWQDLQYPYANYNGVDDGGPWSNIQRVVEVDDTTGNGIADEYKIDTYSKGIFRDFYTRTPKDGAFYIRDKIEYGELIANLGVRYEFFIQAREVKDSVTLVAEGLSWRKILDSQDKIAPRLGFSFPISEKAKLSFNYGHFYQRPGFSQYYQRRTQSTAAAAVFGNPNLDYEKTILYEIGLQYAISEGYRFDLTGYFKDQYGLLNTVPEGIDPNSPDYQANVDYARTRGMEFELEKKYGQFFSGSIKYEYAFAYGKSSSDRSDYYIRFAGGEISIKENPLDWDIRHQLTVSSVLNVNKGEHPHFGIFRLPDDWSMSFLWLFKSGRPFTPDRSYPGLSLGTNENPQTNSVRMPSTSSVDMEFNKNFQVYNINYTFTVLVNNIFDNKNVDYVYTNTGLAYTNLNSNRQIITGLLANQDPTNYTPGRQIMVGLKVRF